MPRNSFQFEWNTKKVMADVDRKTTDSLLHIGDTIAKHIRRNISDRGPPHSVPGEYPKLITGHLRDEVYCKVARNRKGVEVVANTHYARRLEDIRPFVSRTILENLPAIRRLGLREGLVLLRVHIGSEEARDNFGRDFEVSNRATGDLNVETIPVSEF